MGGIRIYAATDPGTGPVEPPAIPSLGVDDYAYAWEASRISGADGDVINQWVDFKAGVTLSHATANKVLHNPGSVQNSYVEFPGGIANALTVAAGLDLGPQKSAVLLARRVGSLENSFLRLDGYRMGVSGTAFSVTGAGTMSGNSWADNTWLPIYVNLDNTTPANSRSRVGANSTTNSGTMTGPHATNDANSVGFNRSGANSGVLQVKALYIFTRTASAAEWNTIAASARLAVLT